jgi:hypothetical protein
MFDDWCDHEGRRVLLFASNITGLRNTADGIEVAYRCHCGRPGTVLTGRRAAGRSAA